MLSRALTLVLVTALLVACGPLGEDRASDDLEPPAVGACRDLGTDDLEKRTNDDDPVACTEPHTAQTFATGALPKRTGAEYGDPGHGKFVFGRCRAAFAKFLGADESQLLRTRLSWAWFGASKRAWAKGARWYRCDVVGGPADAEQLRRLPKTARGLLSGETPDEWTSCARGRTVAGSVKVACSQAHDWRAVTAVKVGQPQDAWPGEKIVRARTRERCSDWVGAWLNYTQDYEFGYTWFHEAEWQAGNRRSVCWARTDQ